MKKIFLICGIAFVLTCVFCGGYYLTIYKPRRTFASEIIAMLGGDGKIKAHCIKDRTGVIKMQDGEMLPRYLTIEDNERINKLCDCTVEKAYSAFSEPKIVNKLTAIKLDAEMAEFLMYALMTHYKTCEYEMLEFLDKRYKAITPDYQNILR